MTARQALIEIGTLPFYGAGWLAGRIVRLAMWLRDAIKAGYREGRGGRAKDEAIK